MSFRLLIIEDDYALAQMLAMHFEDEGYEVGTAQTCAEAVESLNSEACDLVLLDQQLPDGEGIDLLAAIVEQDADLPIVMMTGAHDLDLAIRAIKCGAFDFVHKPVAIEPLQNTIEKALQHRRLAREVQALQSEARHPVSTAELVGRCDAMLTVSKEIALCSASHANVLITGESGTGKEVVANLIHHHSGLPGPFVAVNCAAIVDTLLESELFGHEKGAFTGAVARKIGKFELAKDGTLFLDEIGEMALPLQAKLLRVLQERSFERVGGNQRLSSNARIIAATNRDLNAEVRARQFREDLLYRLNVVTIELPPLRRRDGDLPLLIGALVEKIARNIHKPIPLVTPEAMGLLTTYDWPGNVRELENTLTQAMVHARKDVLTPDLFHLGVGNAATMSTETGELDERRICRSLDRVEAEHIQQVLDYTGGHKGNTCRILDISRPALDRKIRKYELRVPD
ncbi:MAG: sigma-54-dependent Fis family transcriptional regulator [Chromatiales bacterium]|nr:sigma-54-dependent Fis family transcriptional regulator [Gammaproteobacteria bacterium]MCP5230643.1 sigma-54-dependent Fis family transcriptional regulator [Zoogloeaceae bacterium]MCP5352904.1 sigma-54-dependent Fis family transcriptional regulator [Chromatiales bacterium]